MIGFLDAGALHSDAVLEVTLIAYYYGGRVGVATVAGIGVYRVDVALKFLPREFDSCVPSLLMKGVNVHMEREGIGIASLILQEVCHLI